MIVMLQLPSPRSPVTGEFFGGCLTFDDIIALMADGMCASQTGHLPASLDRPVPSPTSCHSLSLRLQDCVLNLVLPPLSHSVLPRPVSAASRSRGSPPVSPPKPGQRLLVNRTDPECVPHTISLAHAALRAGCSRPHPAPARRSGMNAPKPFSAEHG